MHTNDAKPKGRFGCGSPPAIPKPCAGCGIVGVGHRKGLCSRCYAAMLYHKKPKKPTPTMPGLNEFQNYVWNHKDTLTIGQICERMGCTSSDVRGALEAGLIALHRPKTYAVRGKWHL